MVHRQADFLVGLILAAVLAVSLTWTGETFSGEPPFPVFTPVVPETLLLTSPSSLPQPTPDVFRWMSQRGRVLVEQHIVISGDTLYDLGKKYNTTSDSLRSTNRLSSPFIYPGQRLLVHNGKGMLHQVREKKGQVESLADIGKIYRQPPAKIAAVNRLPGVSLLSANVLTSGDLLFVPNARLRFTDYDFPVDWARGKRFLSSGYGMRRHPIYRTRTFHKGWDMPRPYGFRVKSSRKGRVIFAGWRSGYGRLVIVKHAGGIRTWYGHLSKINAAPGQAVKKGTVLGRVGKSGIATGPHLHFEVRDRFGNPLNPKKFLF